MLCCGQMVMGPAGTGKSTYCRVIQEHCQNVKRTVHVVNLDPAAEKFDYEVAFDIRGTVLDVLCDMCLVRQSRYGIRRIV